jgi:hypothetical protein
MRVSGFQQAGAMALAIALGCGAPVQAHHSFAMFDAQKTLKLEGTVKEFQWTNPHTWVQLVVKQPNGTEEEWSIEGASPNALSRQGWSRLVMKPGDKAVISIHPLKDGTHGGALVSATVNGKPVAAGG